MTKLPEKFKESIRALLKDESGFFFKALDEAPSISIRLNPLKEAKIFATEEKVDWCEWGRYLKTRPQFIFDPLFHAGAYYVQESSGMFLFQILKQIQAKIHKATAKEKTLQGGPLIKILDLCAAPGGKTTLISSVFDENALVVANEMIRSRIPVLEENIIKWGTANACISNNDPSAFSKLNNFFDVIVVDAPCSGEGLFRKDKKAVEEWSEANIMLCVARQQRILACIMPALKPGGYLIYSTCTFNTKENEENIAWLINQYHLQETKIEFKSNWPVSVPYLKDQNINQSASFRFYPHLSKGEGFFLACLQKPSEDIIENEVIQKRQNNTVNKNKASLQSWLKDPDNFDCVTDHDSMYAVPKTFANELNYLKKNLNVRYYGIRMGKPDKKNELIPDHALAMSVHLNESIKSIEVNRSDALLYLKKYSPKIEQAKAGWYLLKFEGLALGWIKVLQNRVNNYLPVHYRILKDLQPE